MKTWLLATLLFSLASIANAQNEKPKWQIVIEDDFESRTNPGEDYICKTSQQGGFVVEDGVLIGRQVNDNHGSVIRREIKFSDIQFEFDFRFGDEPGYVRLNVVFDDSTEKSVHAGHISRFSVTRKEIRLQDDKTGFYNKEVRALRMLKNPGSEQKKVLSERLKGKSHSVSVDLKDNRWHHLKATIEGSVMTVSMDGKEVGKLDSPGIDHATRDRFGFTVSGKNSIHFDNWTVSLPQK